MRCSGRLVRLLLGALLLTAPALLNRQPLLYEDIFAYLRGPAVIAAQLGGPRFENAWSRVQAPLAAPLLPGAAAPPPAPEAGAARAERQIEAGRSIYWGSLAYLSWLASGFWLLVALHALVVAWLLDLLLTRCLGLGLAWYGGALAALILLTPLPYYVGYVMPDLLAALGILGAGLLVGFWQALRRAERAGLLLLVAFAGMTHSSHLVTLAVLTAGCALAALLRRTPAPRGAPVLALAACIAVGVAAELLFAGAVRLALHQAPLRLPHIMAHLIEMGPGLDLLSAECRPPAAPFAVCAYLDRLPVGWVAFLFDSDPARGVFGAADMPTKRRISEEQLRFALAVLAHDPWGTIGGLLRDGLRQLVSFGLPDLAYTPKRLAFFAQYFPPALAAGASATLLQANPWLPPLHEAFIYAAALAAAAATCVLLPPGASARDPAREGARALALVVIGGLVVNGLVCGILASPYARFQARVIWLLPLVALALAGLRAAARRPAGALRAA